MPNWLISTLKWGGIVVAVVFAVAFVVSGPSDTPAEGAESTAPIALYWILFIVGFIAAVAGFALGGRQKASG